jgi:hypothetical protein
MIEALVEEYQSLGEISRFGVQETPERYLPRASRGCAKTESLQAVWTAW